MPYLLSRLTVLPLNAFSRSYRQTLLMRSPTDLVLDESTAALSARGVLQAGLVTHLQCKTASGGVTKHAECADQCQESEGISCTNSTDHIIQARGAVVLSEGNGQPLGLPLLKSPRIVLP